MTLMFIVYREQTTHTGFKILNISHLSELLARFLKCWIFSQTCRSLTVSLRDQLRWIYSLLSSGWVSSNPTSPSVGESVFRDTGTNREVSGGFGEELLDEAFLLQTTEPDGYCLCNKPDPADTWQLPAVMRADRILMWRWSRENKCIHRFTDIAASGLYPGC